MSDFNIQIYIETYVCVFPYVQLIIIGTVAVRETLVRLGPEFIIQYLY